MISTHRAWLSRTAVTLATLTIYLYFFPNVLRGVLHAKYPLPKVQSLHQSWGTLQFNRSTSETPLLINGVRYWTGLGTHASSTIKVTIPPLAKKFLGACGLDDHAAGRGQFYCKVEMNRKEVWRSGVISKKNPIESFTISLEETDSLLLIVQALPQGIAFAQANWVDLHFDTGIKT